METTQKILLRDSLQDNGTVPSTFTYWSPDVIPYEEIANHRRFFASNYSQDVAKSIEADSRFNRVYSRVKNLGSEKVTAYVHLYRSDWRLFNNPGAWRDNKLETVSGRDYSRIDEVEPNTIGVCDEPLLLRGDRNAHCMVAVVTDSATYSPPSSFSSYGDYKGWITHATNVALRNTNLVFKYDNLVYQSLKAFHNPFDEPKFGGFRIKIRKHPQIPIGTKVYAKQAAMGIDRAETLRDNTQDFILAVAGNIPAKYDGHLDLSVEIPRGNRWPHNAQVEVTFFSEDNRNRYSDLFAIDPTAIGFDVAVPNTEKNPWIEVGTCNTVFVDRH